MDFSMCIGMRPPYVGSVRREDEHVVVFRPGLRVQTSLDFATCQVVTICNLSDIQVAF